MMKSVMKYLLVPVSALFLMGCGEEPKNPTVNVEKMPEQSAEIAKRKADERKRKSEEIINQSNEEIAIDESTYDKAELLSECKMKVNGQLSDSKYFDANWGNHGYVDKGETVILILPYDAKNSSNSVVSDNAVCVFDKSGVMIKFATK